MEAITKSAIQYNYILQRGALYLYGWRTFTKLVGGRKQRTETEIGIRMV